MTSAAVIIDSIRVKNHFTLVTVISKSNTPKGIRMIRADELLAFFRMNVHHLHAPNICSWHISRVERKTGVSQMVVFPQT